MDNPEAVRKFYQEKLADHGYTAEGMAYRSQESHTRRLRLARRMSGFLPGDSVLDVGCGIGQLPLAWGHDDPLLSFRSTLPKYTGIDLVPQYIAKCREVFWNEPQMWFLLDDFSNPIHLYEPHDIVAALGTFAWQPAEKVYDMIGRMWTLTNHTMIFTALIDRPLPNMWLLQMPKQLSPPAKEWTLHYNHVPGEVMVALHKEGTHGQEEVERQAAEQEEGTELAEGRHEVDQAPA